MVINIERKSKFVNMEFSTWWTGGGSRNHAGDAGDSESDSGKQDRADGVSHPDRCSVWHADAGDEPEQAGREGVGRTYVVAAAGCDGPRSGPLQDEGL